MLSIICRACYPHGLFILLEEIKEPTFKQDLTGVQYNEELRFLGKRIGEGDIRDVPSVRTLWVTMIFH